MIYKRKVLDQILPVLDDQEILVITGLRRVGKTTLLKMLFDKIQSPNKLMLDMENPIHQMLFQEINYDQIINNLATMGIKKDERIYLFLDEIQVIPEIVKPIKYLFDHYTIKFFLTGSSSFISKTYFQRVLREESISLNYFPSPLMNF
jgi:predicted AAA+ superfamily ATPase